MALESFHDLRPRRTRGNNSPIGGGAKVEHGCDADHDTGRHGVNVQPEADEGARDQHDARYKHGADVEGLVPREDQQHSEAAVVTCAEDGALSMCVHAHYRSHMFPGGCFNDASLCPRGYKRLLWYATSSVGSGNT